MRSVIDELFCTIGSSKSEAEPMEDRKMKARIAVLAAAAALSQGSALAQGLEAWDTDASGTISETEFDERFRGAGLFDDWDADGDGLVGSSELAEGLYGFWDANGDADLSVEEWDSGVDFWFGEDEVNLAASEWDADGDGIISEFEFADALGETGLLARLDSDDDDLLDEIELSSGLFGFADGDDDGAIPAEEDGFFTNVAEALAPDEPVDAGEVTEPEASIIEAGEAFSQLPVPCGSGGSCDEVANDFCSALGYGAPIDTLAVEGQLYVVRCTDEP